MENWRLPMNKPTYELIMNELKSIHQHSNQLLKQLMEHKPINSQDLIQIMYSTHYVEHQVKQSYLLQERELLALKELYKNDGTKHNQK